MTNLEIYREKFADSGWRVFEQAIAESRQDKINYVSVEYIISALANDGSNLFHEVMNRLGVDYDAVVNLISASKGQGSHRVGEGVRLSPEVISLFRVALARARAQRRKQIEAADIFIVLSQDSSSPLNQVLGSLNIDQETLMKVVLERTQYDRHPTPSEPRVVRIKSGPYASFTGKVEEFSVDQPTVKVAVIAFGRQTVLELDRDEVEEITFIKR